MPKDKKTQPFTISMLKHLIDKKRINFEPEYQRGFIWKKPQKELFIDSLFLGYDIPKIYFHENRKEDTKYDVVDGQQRLLTIHEFLTGKTKLPSESDPINNEPLSNKYFDNLSDDLQMEFLNLSLDVVILNTEYTQDDIEDMFLRYQNGEPLNAAEKRKAIPGDFKIVVSELANHKIFEKCGFTNKRDAYQDAVAKILHIRFADKFTSITPAAIKRTYLNNASITLNNPNITAVKKCFNFLNSAFKTGSVGNPRWKKFAFLTLTELTYYLLENYAVKDFKNQIAKAYMDFESNRISNSELEEEEQNQTLSSYTDAARGDSPAQQEYRFSTLLNYILSEVPEIPTKDPNRSFTNEQRVAIYHRYEGLCQECKEKIDFSNFHADHIIPHSKGGKTTISNGQVLCSQCNLKKGSQ